ncbi:MAG: ribosome-associated translation inhibitor RaiA [Clostridiales bacterium]|nr:ribosome-associated translation inhibitor RaiA [Clostridiales bacterium]
MKISISGRHMDVTDDVRAWAEKKFSKLEKYFKQEAEAQLTFITMKHGSMVKLEATIHHRGWVYRAETVDHDEVTVIDKAVEVIDRQIRKNKTKLEKKFHSGAFDNLDAGDGYEQSNHEIVKSKKFPIKPMSVEEAVLQMDLIGHEFFMFRNAEDEEINVVYRRKDGKYGLIEPEL